MNKFNINIKLNIEDIEEIDHIVKTIKKTLHQEHGCDCTLDVVISNQKKNS